MQRNRMRPRPQRGQGWRKGGFKFSKKDFYNRTKKYYHVRNMIQTSLETHNVQGIANPLNPCHEME